MSTAAPPSGGLPCPNGRRLGTIGLRNWNGERHHRVRGTFAGERIALGFGYAVPVSLWRGGHRTEPYEQNTQQSPSRGRNNPPHLGHWYEWTHAFSGMDSRFANPQKGHVIVLVSINAGICLALT